MNEQDKNLLDDFLLRWPLDEVKKMTLKEYVGTNNKDTFCQWVETKTKILGSIKGWSSIKFGIYERKDPKVKWKYYVHDDLYSWLPGYPNTRKEVFESVKNDIINTIEYSGRGEFSKIDKILLPDLFKWKVAFLYSNERLIPIYKKEVLFKIGHSLGLKKSKKTKISEIQDIMMENKPSHLSVYDYMRFLYPQFGNKTTPPSSPKSKFKRRRKPVTSKNTNPQTRSSVSRSYIVEQKHNMLQEALKEKLINQYGLPNVILEENNVDIKLLQPKLITYYEIKSSPYASDCIREALGQILSYTFDDRDPRIKKLVVAGQYPPNIDDLKFIDYIKSKVKMTFDYESIDI